MTLLETAESASIAAPRDVSLAAPAVDDVARRLSAIYHGLEARADLRPGAHVDALFHQLVHLVLSTPDELAVRAFDDVRVSSLAPRLRELCATGETELELAWARRIGGSDDPSLTLSQFPYLSNYRLLARMEAGAVARAVDHPVRSLAFVGSGPLPMSAFLLARELGAAVDGIDRDPVAVTTARRLARALGLSHLRIVHEGAGRVDLSGYDVVVLAALVGATGEEKAGVLAHLARSMAPGATLLIRSARGMRMLLYPEVERTLLDEFDVRTVIHPDGEVINSVIVAQIPRRGAVPVPRPGSEA
ncbi:nicotianamine synthase family protein [Phytoactinopolyspora halophila]|uniref:nicotianamine synthase family protein n=1 Tax=Phytoactinopolyspora halophila TaxID=1981511 RepID=UPI0013145481|nr:nicotianamine synthase family protein [Phytoactinopolyspora halophila]